MTAGLLPLIFLFPEGGKQSNLEIFPLGKKYDTFYKITIFSLLSSDLDDFMLLNSLLLV